MSSEARSSVAEVRRGNLIVGTPPCPCGSGTWEVQFIPVPDIEEPVTAYPRVFRYRDVYDVERVCLRGHRGRVDFSDVTMRLIENTISQ